MLHKAASEPVLIPFNARADGKDHTGHDNDIPIILFTGIHGKASELHAVAKSFDKLCAGNSPIYICNSSFPDNRDPKYIADTILRVRNNSQLPYILIGYSFGGILANKVSEILQHGYAHSYLPITYGIDITSPDCTQDYFDSDQLSANQDLLLIVNHAAALAGLKPLEADQETFNDFEYYFAERKFNAITTKLLAQQASLTPEKEQRFNKLIEIIRQNLAHLTITTPYFSKKPKSGHFIFTTETMNKHPHLRDEATKAFTGGWDQCCESIEILTSKDGLEKLSHLDLVKEGHAESVAKLISANMDIEIQKALKSVVPQFVKQSFQGIKLEKEHIAFMRNIIELFIKNSFKHIGLDGKTIDALTNDTMKLMAEAEDNFRKEASSSQTKMPGQAFSLFAPAPTVASTSSTTTLQTHTVIPVTVN